jgi:uncharacterized protein (DUF3820 family)
MALRQLKEGLDKFCENDPAEEILAYVNNFIAENQMEYTANVAKNCMTFGKWKGFTVKELSKDAKGRDYIQWLLKQAWFTEDKNQGLFDEMRLCGLLKKI